MHTPDFATAAALARITHPKAPVLAILDVTFYRRGLGPIDADAPWPHPASPFGQLVAEAFDATSTTPEEWRRWTGPGADVSLRDSLLEIWREEVLPRFLSRYGSLTAADAGYAGHAAFPRTSSEATSRTQVP